MVGWLVGWCLPDIKDESSKGGGSKKGEKRHKPEASHKTSQKTVFGSNIRINLCQKY